MFVSISRDWALNKTSLKGIGFRIFIRACGRSIGDGILQHSASGTKTPKLPGQVHQYNSDGQNTAWERTAENPVANLTQHCGYKRSLQAILANAPDARTHVTTESVMMGRKADAKIRC